MAVSESELECRHNNCLVPRGVVPKLFDSVVRYPAMKKSANPSCNSARRCARPLVEELELRTLPSAAALRVAADIIRSPENLQNAVTSDYMTFLHRAADATGLTGWVN